MSRTRAHASHPLNGIVGGGMLWCALALLVSQPPQPCLGYAQRRFSPRAPSPTRPPLKGGRTRWRRPILTCARPRDDALRCCAMNAMLCRATQRRAMFEGTGSHRRWRRPQPLAQVEATRTQPCRRPPSLRFLRILCAVRSSTSPATTRHRARSRAPRPRPPRPTSARRLRRQRSRRPSSGRRRALHVVDSGPRRARRPILWCQEALEAKRPPAKRRRLK